MEKQDFFRVLIEKGILKTSGIYKILKGRYSYKCKCGFSGNNPDFKVLK